LIFLLIWRNLRFRNIWQVFYSGLRTVKAFPLSINTLRNGNSSENIFAEADLTRQSLISSLLLNIQILVLICKRHRNGIRIHFIL